MSLATNSCRGMSAADKTKYHLADPDTFRYLSSSGCTQVDGLDDALEYAEMEAAMTSVGVSPEEKDATFRLLSAVLHLGNVQFEAKDDACVI